jgi:hypothetical protein
MYDSVNVFRVYDNLLTLQRHSSAALRARTAGGEQILSFCAQFVFDREDTGNTVGAHVGDILVS